MGFTMNLSLLRKMQQGLSDGICKIAELEIERLAEYKEAIEATIHQEYRVFRDFHIWKADLDTIDLEFLDMLLPLFRRYADSIN